MMKLESVFVTPALANKWLSKEHPNNRKPSEHRVEMYADDMRAGRWHDNGETIKFDRDGTLIDGGHRVRAVIMSGKSVAMCVAHGAVIDGIDRGRTRSVVDIRRMNGSEALNIYIAAVKVIYSILYNGALMNRPVSDDQVSSVEADYPITMQWLTENIRKKPAATVWGSLALVHTRSPDVATRVADEIVGSIHMERVPSVNVRSFLTQIGKNETRRRVAALTLHLCRYEDGGVRGRDRERARGWIRVRTGDEESAFEYWTNKPCADQRGKR